MRRILFILSVVFIVLTFVGAIYVISNNGRKNPGYAVVPMVFALTCISAYRSKRND